ncbi:unnamed protein product [Taenia asiatica]|uniref:Integrase n=1 Tax=Taenia asiatica TaxID=60517 RepID=A0A0R3WDI5_TAEAS|nr:unnamed protein product [Taenia asiatica]
MRIGREWRHTSAHALTHAYSKGERGRTGKRSGDEEASLA